MNILIVDQDRDVCLLVSIILKDLGHIVQAVNNGDAALTYLATHEVHILISDWDVGDMNGLTLSERVRERSKGFVYYILLTQINDSGSIVEGLQGGADDYIPKPVDLDELKVRIRVGARLVALQQQLEKQNQALDEAVTKINNELKLAAKMQQAYLPEPSCIAGISFDWLFKPCHYIGGDMFGYFSIDAQHTAFYLLDVAGHGVTSALFSFTLNKMIQRADHGEVYRPERDSNGLNLLDPVQVANTLNDRFQITTHHALYFTMVYGVYHVETGEVRLVRAGHPYPLHKKKSGELSIITEGNLPIGMIKDVQYLLHTFTLEQGEQLYLYSDGITEARDENQNMLKESGLLEMILDCEEDTSPIAQMEEKLTLWQSSSEFEDDLTLLVISRLKQD